MSVCKNSDFCQKTSGHIPHVNNTTWGQQEWRKLGFASLEDFLVGFWEGFFLDRRDPNNLLCMLETWHDANVGLTTGFFGDHEKALASIKVYPVISPGTGQCCGVSHSCLPSAPYLDWGLCSLLMRTLAALTGGQPFI